MVVSNNSHLISILVPSLVGGGQERVRVHLSRAFVERGLRVDMVLSKAKGPFLAELPPGVRLVDLRAPRVRYSLLALVRYLKRARPCAVLSVSPQLSTVALAARALSRVPFRLVLTANIFLSLEAKISRYTLAPLLPGLARYFYPLADRVVAVSHGVADDVARITRIPKKAIRVIYNPVPVKELAVKAREPLKHRFFASPEPPVILAAGRLVPQKDFSTLLRAFAYVTRRTQARLVILGEGEERRKLEGIIRKLGLGEHVDMPGFVENPYAYMSRAAVFILSSACEGLSNVILEALACGCPVVSTDCPSGPTEILNHGKYGLLARVGDARGLGDAIQRSLEHPPDPEVLRKRASEFSVDRSAEEYLELLLADRARTRPDGLAPDVWPESRGNRTGRRV